MVSERSISEINRSVLAILDEMLREVRSISKNLSSLQEKLRSWKNERIEDYDEDMDDKELQRETRGDRSIDQQPDPETNLNLKSDQNQILGLNRKPKFDRELDWNPKSNPNRDVDLNPSPNSDSKFDPKLDRYVDSGKVTVEEAIDREIYDDEDNEEKEEKKEEITGNRMEVRSDQNLGRAPLLISQPPLPALLPTSPLLYPSS